MKTEVKRDRITERIEELAQYTDTPGAGVTRCSYSANDRKARNYIIGECRRIGLEVKEDPLGNLRARYHGTNDSLTPVWIGSHIDSVRNGGKYDGVAGVVSALEVLNVLYENRFTPIRPVELVIFAEEEGSNFGTTMLGSKAIAGKYDVDYLHTLKDSAQIPAYERIREFGLNPDRIGECRIGPGDIYAMIELHIEQGIVLDREEKIIGVVEAIAGMHTYRIEISGESNHAGATPMNLRHDPMTAAGRLICDIEKYVNDSACGTTVATVGEIECSPNMPNVIPQKVRFSVDIRDVRQDGIDRTVEYIRKRSRTVAQERGVEIVIRQVGTSECIRLSSDIAGRIEKAAEKERYSCRRMNSGAVHDSAMLAGITEVGMIFVPSVDGKSHNTGEYTKEEHIAAGADVLLDVVRELMMEE